MFINLMSRFPHMKAVLWTWLSGSSNLASNVAGAPFYAICRFPVDLRCGWDVSLPARQVLLTRPDDLFKPSVTTFEPRCKFWTIPGPRGSPRETAALRASEGPMLSFVASHACKIHHNSRLWWLENLNHRPFGLSHL